jgi:hypothetical protein
MLIQCCLYLLFDCSLITRKLIRLSLSLDDKFLFVLSANVHSTIVLFIRSTTVELIVDRCKLNNT